MKREYELQILRQTPSWDIIVIGGGATGAYIALDAVTRGFSVLLLESYDFAKGTSSRSTKLLHGGVRYLAQGNTSLVYEALHERNRFFQNAPNLCKQQQFIIPTNNFLKALYYHFGLKIYDFLATKDNRKLHIEKTSYINKTDTLEKLKGIKEKMAQHGISYYDGCFDDARMNLSLIKTANKYGACILNYMKVTNFYKDYNNGMVKGVIAYDKLNQQEITIHAQCVINATGVFSNETSKSLNEDNLLEKATKTNCFGDSFSPTYEITPSQGVHLVIAKEFFPNEVALMIPKTSDGRVLFCIPWYDNVLLGTTDTPLKTISIEPKALDEEIDFILKTAGEYLTKQPTRQDIKSVFAGLRPLVNSKHQTTTKELSRSHKIDISKKKLVSIIGGKWTTARAMAEDTLNKVMEEGLLETRICKTKEIMLEDCNETIKYGHRLSVYGTKAQEIIALEEKEEYAKKIHKDYPYTYAQVYWALEYEMAQNLEDILARRIRLLFIDAKASEECAKEVGKFVAKHANWNENKLYEEVQNFINLARHYQPKEHI